LKCLLTVGSASKKDEVFIRLKDINCPESRGQGARRQWKHADGTKELEGRVGKRATQFVIKNLKVGMSMRLNSYKDKKGSFARYIFDVWYIKRDDPTQYVLLNDELVDVGLAVYVKY